MNLLVRNNLLFRLVSAPDPRLKLDVARLEEYAKDVKNPKMVVQKVRTDLTDEKRTFAIYGSTVVIARLTGRQTACASTC